jgi:hypothetical protein
MAHPNQPPETPLQRKPQASADGKAQVIDIAAFQNGNGALATVERSYPVGKTAELGEK